MKTPSPKMSTEQKNLIIDFMEQNIDFAQGTAVKVKNGPTYNEMWNQLTLMLNKTTGPKKDKIKWQKVWSGIKKGTKTKLKKIQIYHDNKTGNCIYYPRLTAVDERIISIMKSKSNKNLNESKKENIFSVIKMKAESPNKKRLENISPINSILMDQMFPSDDEYSDTTYEECSNFSWNSHDIQKHKDSNIKSDTIIFKEKMEAVSLQLERLIEQNSVTNILLERIASTLENKKMYKL